MWKKELPNSSEIVGSGDTAGDHDQDTLRHEGDLTYEICASRSDCCSRENSETDTAEFKN